MSLLFLCLLLNYDGITQADTLILEANHEIIDISSHLTYLPDATDESFSWPSFQYYQGVLIEDYSDDITASKLNWFLVRLANNSSSANISEWVLHFPLLLTDINHILILDDGTEIKGRSGAFVPVKERSFAPMAKGNYGKISLPHKSTARLYLGLKTERIEADTDFRVKLLPVSKFHQSRTNEQLFNGIFIGFVLLMLLYNLFLYLQVKDRAFIYYSAYLFALMLFGLYNTGNLADGVNSWVLVDKPQYVFFFKLSTYPGIFAYLIFLRVFLNLDKLLPAWDFSFKWLGWLALPLMMIDAIVMCLSNFNYASADVFTLGYAIAFLALIFLFIIILWREKAGGKKRYFIIAGVVAMGIGILITIIQRIKFVEFSSLYFRIGTIIEVVIFSLGLAYRQRENQLKQQSAVFALEKAEMLQQQKVLEAQRLVELDDAKNRFYTHITHEFRTPLTVIMGVTDHLDSQSFKQGVSAENRAGLTHSLSLIRRNSKQLLGQINELLDLAKLESGAMPLNYVQADVISFLEYLAESFHSLAEERKVRLLFYPEERQLIMDFDETKLQYIVYNLLSNALKFSNEKGKIVLHAKKIEQEGALFLQLKVSDTGQGISPEHQLNVFNRFYQVADKQGGQMGSGVGLTLTKELIELMNGTVQLESQLNEGTVVTVLLPISNDAHLVNESGLINSFVNPVELNENTGGGSKGIESDLDVLEEDKQEYPDRAILLLVEDNEDIVSFLRNLLASTYQLEVAKDGKEGIQLAFELIPDIVISDVMMPEMNGLELTNKLKTDERTSHIPIILLTAKASEIDKMEGLRQGADAYLLKPFNKEELMLRLENLLALKKSTEKKYTKGESTARDSVTQKDWAEISVDDLFLNKLKQIVNAHIADTNFSTADLSEAVNLSQSQLYRKLKAVTGDTPSNFIRNIRLNYSLELLKNPSLNISEVAYQCGFKDPNYFSRAFHKLFGKSPTQYRH